MRGVAAGRMGNCRLLLFCCVPLLCSTQESCTATQSADQTVYSISAEFGVSADNAPDYEYSWSTVKEVLATHKGVDNLHRVKTNTINDLALFECDDTIIFKRTSISTGRQYKTSCPINCTQHSHLEQQTVNGTLHPPVEQKEIPHNQPAWIIPVVVVAVVAAVMLVGLLGYFCYRKKQQISRKCRHVYDLVRMKNGDVESGNM